MPESYPLHSFGQTIIRLDVVDSTNRYAMRLLQEAEPPAAGTVVVAYDQVAGRGQQEAKWHSAPGQNLTFSVVLHPRGLAAGELFRLNKAIALGLADALQEILTPAHTVQLKWPNDLLVAGRKAAGILIENILVGSRVEASVVGIGLNVNQREFPVMEGRKATSLSLLTGRLYSLEEVLRQVLHSLEQRYNALLAGAHLVLDGQYLARLYRYQEWSQFRAEGEAFWGMIVGVRADGQLALQRQEKLAYYEVKQLQFL